MLFFYLLYFLLPTSTLCRLMLGRQNGMDQQRAVLFSPLRLPSFSSCLPASAAPPPPAPLPPPPVTICSPPPPARRFGHHQISRDTHVCTAHARVSTSHLFLLTLLSLAARRQARQLGMFPGGLLATQQSFTSGRQRCSSCTVWHGRYGWAQAIVESWTCAQVDHKCHVRAQVPFLQ